MNGKVFSRVSTLILVGIGLMMPPPAPAQLTGRQIMDRQEKLHETKDEEFAQDMLLISRAGETRKREIINYYIKVGGLSKSMLIFLSPSDVKGTGLLTWEQKDRDDDQWLYLPAQRRERRISASGKKNKFMGTDFAYEDLRPEKLDDHNYNLLRSEVLGGLDCYVVEALPATEAEKRESGYSKRIMWIRKDIFYTIKTEYYNKQGLLEKVSVNEELEKLTDTMYRAKKTTMEDLRSKHKTVLATTERKINQGIPESKFTLRELKR